jgi:hypothetical protein
MGDTFQHDALSLTCSEVFSLVGRYEDRARATMRDLEKPSRHPIEARGSAPQISLALQTAICGPNRAWPKRE